MKRRHFINGLVGWPIVRTLYPADGEVVEAVLFVQSGMASLLATMEGGEQVGVGVVSREGLPLVLGDDRSLGRAATDAQVRHWYRGGVITIRATAR